ncbi:MAG: hypothetical protein ACE5OO_07090 [Candidatus Bathyarchaeia archaeon]
MSQYSAVRGRSARAILEHLVLHRETAQLELPRVVGCSYRTVLREIRGLEELGFVELACLERVKKHGKSRYIRRPTFLGVLEVFKESADDPEALSRIAERHRDAWVIFREWGHIAGDAVARDLMLSAIRACSAEGRPGWISPEGFAWIQKARILNKWLWGTPEFGVSGLISRPESLDRLMENPGLRDRLLEVLRDGLEVRRREMEEIRRIVERYRG